MMRSEGRRLRQEDARFSQMCELLYRLGATGNYIGFTQMAYAVWLCAEDQNWLILVTKRLYPEVARQYHTNWRAVERNLRTVGNAIWTRGRSHLEALARRPLGWQPHNTELLAILSHSLNPSYSGPLALHGLGETVALTGEDYDVGVVDQAVNEGSGEPVIAKNGVPLGELQV